MQECPRNVMEGQKHMIKKYYIIVLWKHVGGISLLQSVRMYSKRELEEYD